MSNAPKIHWTLRRISQNTSLIFVICAFLILQEFIIT
jgi:hypothetical protein